MVAKFDCWIPYCGRFSFPFVTFLQFILALTSPFLFRQCDLCWIRSISSCIAFDVICFNRMANDSSEFIRHDVLLIRFQHPWYYWACQIRSWKQVANSYDVFVPTFYLYANRWSVSYWWPSQRCWVLETVHDVVLYIGCSMTNWIVLINIDASATYKRLLSNPRLSAYMTHPANGDPSRSKSSNWQPCW